MASTEQLNEKHYLSPMDVVDTRKLSTSSITNKRRKSSVSYEKIRYGNTTKTSNKPETKLEAFDNASNARRKSSSTFFTNSMMDTVQERNAVHSRERYRKVLREIYAEEEEKTKTSAYKQENKVNKTRGKDACDGTSSKFVSFIQYMSTEHETLLQFLVFLPLILTALYIAIVEQKPLVKYR